MAIYIYIKQSPDRVEIHFNQIQAAPVKVAGERRQMHATCVSACMCVWGIEHAICAGLVPALTLV